MEPVLKGNLVMSDRVIHGGLISIEGNRITGIFPPDRKSSPPPGNIRDFGEAYICPGLIDLHTHGAAGVDSMDGGKDSISVMAQHQSRCGVTGFLAATLTAPLDALLRSICNLKDAASLNLQSGLLGIYIEGPFISRHRAGMHRTDVVCRLNEDTLTRLFLELEGMPAVFALAPEEGTNMFFIGPIKEKGGIPAIGHSDASYDQALESIRRGISHACHLFNAMRGFHHREPGVVGAVLDSDEVTAEIIADGVHLHPAAVRLAVKRKGVDGICLVTDSGPATGLGEGIYAWNDSEFEVRRGEARVKGSDILAGSVLTLNKAVRNVLEWTGLPVNEVVRMASLIPAGVLGLDRETGSLEMGKRADLAVFDRSFDVIETIFGGNTTFVREL